MTAALAPVWVTARAAGIGALLASSLTACLGLTSALKPRFLQGRRLELHAAHEALALVTVALIGLHGLALMLDPVLKANLVALLVPFAVPYRSLATGLGQLAAYGMIGLGLTFYGRRRLGGTRRWRNAHRYTPVFWALAVFHGLLGGTDAQQWWFQATLALPVLTAGGLIAARHADAALPETHPGL